MNAPPEVRLVQFSSLAVCMWRNYTWDYPLLSPLVLAQCIHLSDLIWTPDRALLGLHLSASKKKCKYYVAVSAFRTWCVIIFTSIAHIKYNITTCHIWWPLLFFTPPTVQPNGERVEYKIMSHVYHVYKLLGPHQRYCCLNFGKRQPRHCGQNNNKFCMARHMMPTIYSKTKCCGFKSEI